MARVVVPLVLKRARRAHHRLLRVLERIHALLQLAVLIRQLSDVVRVPQPLTRVLVERAEALRDLLTDRRNARREVLPVLHADGKEASRPAGRAHVACGDKGPCAHNAAQASDRQFGTPSASQVGMRSSASAKCLGCAMRRHRTCLAVLTRKRSHIVSRARPAPLRPAAYSYVNFCMPILAMKAFRSLLHVGPSGSPS